VYGHAKSSSIKHKQGAAGATRGTLWTKLARAGTVAARGGGGNVEANPALGLAVQKARDASMPKDNIQRAIKRGTGELGGAALEEKPHHCLVAKKAGKPERREAVFGNRIDQRQNRRIRPIRSHGQMDAIWCPGQV